MKLTDTQLILLSAASQRDDRGIELPPNLKGGAAHKVVGKLLETGLAEEIRPRGTLPAWRRDEEIGALEATDVKIVWLRATGERWEAICWKVGSHGSQPSWLYALCAIAGNSVSPARRDGIGSLQRIPGRASATVSSQMTLFDQLPEVLLQRVSARPRQLDHVAGAHTPMLTGMVENAQRKLRQA